VEDEERAREIILAYEDKAFSYTDATTFAVMERTGIKTAFAFDSHFLQFGFTLYM
jgi:predicted nucleic acid-binding protein